MRTYENKDVPLFLYLKPISAPIDLKTKSLIFLTFDNLLKVTSLICQQFQINKHNNGFRNFIQMYKEKLHEEISTLIEKIRMDWSRIKSYAPGIHNIDKDIITGDIRRLYDLIYEIDFEKSSAKIREISQPTPLQETIKAIENHHFNDKNIPKSNSDSSPSISVIFKEEFSSEIVQTNHEKTMLEQQNVELTHKNFPQKPSQQKINLASNPKFEERLENTPPNRDNHSSKSTIDLFTAPKTIADVFQATADNSVASRMQHNPIKDIKSAIGINEKFLFINTIFRGEISAYNAAIEQLNTFVDFYQAVHFIDELKLEFEKENNKDSFSKLVDIVKRKFQ